MSQVTICLDDETDRRMREAAGGWSDFPDLDTLRLVDWY
jgi:hypothetical protein